jgi:hypothetical protein
MYERQLEEHLKTLEAVQQRLNANGGKLLRQLNGLKSLLDQMEHFEEEDAMKAAEWFVSTEAFGHRTLAITGLDETVKQDVRSRTRLMTQIDRLRKMVALKSDDGPMRKFEIDDIPFTAYPHWSVEGIEAKDVFDAMDKAEDLALAEICSESWIIEDSVETQCEWWSSATVYERLADGTRKMVLSCGEPVEEEAA